MQEKYFVASNSKRGFCSYYDSTFDTEKFSKIYLVKGGSGTGKARLMQSIAQRAEMQGCDVRYIYCSSDYESLDAVILKNLHVAILDATAPHTREPRLVGAVESVVDLGALLNEDLLGASRGVIEGLNNEKREGFERAYKYLQAYGSLTENMENIVRPTVKADKIKRYVKRLAEGVSEGDGETEHLLAASLGMKGACRFSTYRDRAKIYLGVADVCETAHFLLREMQNAFEKKKAHLHVSNDPLIPERLDAICDAESGFTAEIVSEPQRESRTVNMRRFVDADGLAKIKSEYREIANARAETLRLATAELAKVAKSHFILEKIYGSAMDFEKKESLTTTLCTKILG